MQKEDNGEKNKINKRDRFLNTLLAIWKNTLSK